MLGTLGTTSHKECEPYVLHTCTANPRSMNPFHSGRMFIGHNVYIWKSESYTVYLWKFVSQIDIGPSNYVGRINVTPNLLDISYAKYLFPKIKEQNLGTMKVRSRKFYWRRDSSCEIRGNVSGLLWTPLHRVNFIEKSHEVSTMWTKAVINQ